MHTVAGYAGTPVGVSKHHPFPQVPPMVIYIPTVQSFWMDRRNRSSEALKANIGMAMKGVLGYWPSVE